MGQPYVIPTNSFALASDFTDVLIQLSNELFPQEILQAIQKFTCGEDIQNFAGHLENHFIEGMDAEYSMTYRLFNEGGSLGLFKMLSMQVDNSGLEELRAFHEGRISAHLERRKTANDTHGQRPIGHPFNPEGPQQLPFENMSPGTFAPPPPTW